MGNTKHFPSRAGRRTSSRPNLKGAVAARLFLILAVLACCAVACGDIESALKNPCDVVASRGVVQTCLGGLNVRKYDDPQPGTQFGFWTVVEKTRRPGQKGHSFLCRCKCGQERIIGKFHLWNGLTESCRGCRSENRFPFARHLPLRWVWDGINKRCNNPASMYHGYYGGRGIKVCTEWKSFDIFAAWALSNGYKRGLQIDRIDNNVGYSPENCRFVTRSVNCNNTRRNLNVSAFGETKTVTEWSRDDRCAVSFTCLIQRIKKHKWSPEESITTPVRCLTVSGVK